MDLSQKIEALTGQLLNGTDKFLVDFTVKPGNRFMIFIDGDQGVTIEDCRNLSRAIEKTFDRDIEDYELTVSSAGLDHPLRSIRQFRKNIGREVEITTTDGITSIEGILITVDEDGIELEHPVKKKKDPVKPNTKISFSHIKSAKIIIKFGK